MTKQIKKQDPAGPVAYCGPTIPGVAKRFTVYRNGIPKRLDEKTKEVPAMGALIVPLTELPAAMESLRRNSGNTYRLYQLVQAKL